MSEVKNDLNGLRMLIAEDDNMNILVLTKFVQRWGVITDVAKNGREAVDKCMEGTYDVILMDMFMPVMNGIEASVEIRKFNTTTPIFALTADASSDTQENAKTAGINDVITKPFKPEELFEKLSAVYHV
jgi:two-component system sensor histidine kinase/response regulator